MKKLFFLLFAVVVLTACHQNDHDFIYEILGPGPSSENPPKITWVGDWNDPSNSNYKPEGYNPIEGQWIVMKENKANVNYFRVYQFSNTRHQSVASSKPADGQEPTFLTKTAYMINNYAFKINDSVFGYSLSEDSKVLNLKIVNTNLTLIPYSDWKWNGDWNNPADPHYATYNGKYNPVAGIWQLISMAGNDVADRTIFYRFNDDFTTERSSTKIITFTQKHKYWINGTSIKEDTSSSNGVDYASTIFKYTIKEDTLFYKSIDPTSDQLVLVKYK